jgi:serine/threonine-protein kinase
MIGTQIGNYQVVEKIGEGGMGVVYRGVDVTLDRPVAIKVLSQELVGTPALVERFRAEARAQANLNHTNIATLYTFMQVDGVCVMVMELLEGETFDQIIRRRGVIPAEEAVPLFRQALLGIGFAHRMGIVHRDIKPSNIMLTKSGIVKVMDFGIAKVLGGQRMTRTGTRMGTVAYMSPEQIRNMPVDIRSDIYSLGATLYEMFTAHLPFESESDFQVMSDHVNTVPPPPTRYYPYIAPGFEQCVMKALEKNPDQRFQTVEEFGAGLEHPLGLPGYVPGMPAAQVAWTPQPPQPQPGAWTPPPPQGTPTGQPGGWTPTGAAPGGQWTPPAAQRPSGNWTPPPGTPAGGTYSGSGTPPPGQPSMSGATWIGDGPPSSGTAYSPGMSGATQATIPPGPGTGAPTTSASAGPSKNLIFVILGAAALILIILAVAVAHFRNSDNTGGGGGSASSTYSSGGGGGGGGGSTSGGSSGGGSSSGETGGNVGSAGGSGAPGQTAGPVVGSGGSGGLTGGNNSGSSGIGGLVPQPTAPSSGNGGASHPAQPHKAAPAAPSGGASSSAPSANEAPPASAPAAAPAAPAAVAPSAGSHRYFVQHRHLAIDFKSKTGTSQSYCEGYLTVSSDGTGSYYCTQTFDGRCDRVAFGKGSIHSVKISGTQLHLSSSYGNYDFYGTAADMQAAFAALSETIKH